MGRKLTAEEVVGDRGLDVIAALFSDMEPFVSLMSCRAFRLFPLDPFMCFGENPKYQAHLMILIRRTRLRCCTHISATSLCLLDHVELQCANCSVIDITPQAVMSHRTTSEVT